MFRGQFSEEWRDVREKCLRTIKAREQKVLKDWCKLIEYNEPVGYHLDIMEGIVTLYVGRIGQTIGKGKNIPLLKQLLEREYHREFEVSLIEVRGGFINVGEDND